MSYIPLPLVATRLGLPIRDLLQRIEKYKISVRIIDEQTAMSTADIPTLTDTPPLTDRPAYIAAHFADLVGKPISMNEAARKYDVSSANVSNWSKRGYIAKIGQEKNRVLVDESQVAYCAAVYNARSGAGRWLFDDNGQAYIPENRTTAEAEAALGLPAN